MSKSHHWDDEDDDEIILPCTGKEAFRCEKTALDALRRVTSVRQEFARGVMPNRVYECNNRFTGCGYYHLTSQAAQIAPTPNRMPSRSYA